MLENLSPEILEAILEALPVEITFVDKDDTVRFFNKGTKRIFPRPAGVIGRKVQNCHPKKSLDAVNRILAEFKNGTRTEAAFWIDLPLPSAGEYASKAGRAEGKRKILIRYFPVRSKDGQYLGCIEATQDITDIKKIEGEKRLLDE